MENLTSRIPEISLLAVHEFIPLIWSAMHLKNINSSELARQTGMTKSKLSRVLTGKSPIELTALPKIFLVLNIDTQRALLAVSQFGDWNRYYDPDVIFLSDLVQKLPDTLASAREGCERVEVNSGGVDYIAGHIGAMIADNDRKVSERRNGFASEFASRPASTRLAAV